MEKIIESQRKTKKCSKRKLTNAILLFEQYVDEEISSIDLELAFLGVYYIKTGTYYKWKVDISKNKVEKIYPDI